MGIVPGGFFCVAAVNGNRNEKISRFHAAAMTTTALPTKANRRRWGITMYTDTKCTLCKRETETVRHILTGCKVALTQDRYTLRHNFVLKELSKFLRASQNTAQQHFDLPGERNLPSWWFSDILLRPDALVTLSDGTEYIIELIVPWEEAMDASHQRKRDKYNAILHRRRMSNPRCQVDCQCQCNKLSYSVQQNNNNCHTQRNKRLIST